jgi:hypothetical protein
MLIHLNCASGASPQKGVAALDDGAIYFFSKTLTYSFEFILFGHQQVPLHNKESRH